MNHFSDLDSIRNEIRYQKALVDFFDPEHSTYSLADAKAALHKAREQLRVFTYRQHQSITPKGRSIRL